jgi:4-amino-4-deoxy-L-arabinose transferase-like glycosyltransferase
VMMTAVYAVTGHAPEIVIFFQLLLGSATSALTLLLARALRFSTVVGVAAALVAALDPVSAMTSNLLLTETLFTALLTTALALIALHWHFSGLRWLVAGAVLLGLAALVRPVSQFLPLVLAPVVLAASYRRGARAGLIAVVLFLAISMGITYSWAYRNYQASALFTLSTVSDTNLVYYRAREVLASAEGIGQEEAKHRLEAMVTASAPGRALTPSETAAIEQQQALAVFREHPVQTIAMLGKGAARIFVDPGYSTTCTLLDPSNTSMECFEGEATMNDSGVIGRIAARFLQMTAVQQFVLIWSIVLSAAVYLCATLGVVGMIRERRWYPSALLVVVFGYLVLLSAGSEAYSRFRIPMVPLLAIAAGAGLHSLWERLQRGRSGQLAQGSSFR